MLIGSVVGNVVATQKLAQLEGVKLMLVQPLGLDDASRGAPVLAIDMIDAGIGDRVLLVQDGKAAQAVLERGVAAVDAAIVGIIDSVSVVELGGPAPSPPDPPRSASGVTPERQRGRAGAGSR